MEDNKISPDVIFNLMGGKMFTTFISTHGTTIPKMHQDFSLSFLWSALEEQGLLYSERFILSFKMCAYVEMNVRMLKYLFLNKIYSTFKK